MIGERLHLMALETFASWYPVFAISKYSRGTFNVSLDVISHISTCLFCVFRWWSLPGTTINSMLGARMNFDPSPGMDTLGICLVSEVIILHVLCVFYYFLQFAGGCLLRKPKSSSVSSHRIEYDCCTCRANWCVIRLILRDCRFRLCMLLLFFLAIVFYCSLYNSLHNKSICFQCRISNIGRLSSQSHAAVDLVMSDYTVIMPPVLLKYQHTWHFKCCITKEVRNMDFYCL